MCQITAAQLTAIRLIVPVLLYLLEVRRSQGLASLGYVFGYCSDLEIDLSHETSS